MQITDENGRTLEQRIREILNSISSELRDKASRQIQSSIKTTIQRHFQQIYPGSQHYSPSRVTDGPGDSVIVNVPGITRAYHDLNIKPIRAQKLAIPLHKEAFGVKSPKDVPNLFYVKNKNGTEMLAKNEGGALVVMYILKDSVHQAQNPDLMPSDDTIVQNINERLAALIDRAVKSTN